MQEVAHLQQLLNPKNPGLKPTKSGGKALHPLETGV